MSDFLTSIGTALAGGILALSGVAITPALQHVFWRRQKLRETKIDTAKRFQALASEIGFKLFRLQGDGLENLEALQFRQELMMVLASAEVIFEDPETLKYLDLYFKALKIEDNLDRAFEVGFLAPYLIRKLLGEAFGLDKRRWKKPVRGRNRVSILEEH